LENSPFKFEIYGLHKSFGIIILALVIGRIIWKAINPKPMEMDTHEKWEKTLAKLAHGFLYLSMIGMPLTGWLMSSAGGHPVKLFGLELPALMEKNPDIGKLMNQTHEILSYMLIAAILLHAVGAFKHHFIDRDNTLKRMMAKPVHGFGPYIAVMITGVFAVGVAYFIVLN
jgi:cytochrome b561